MNICTPGNCICDAAEWPGDTNCMGEVEGEDPFTLSPEKIEQIRQECEDRRYYFSLKYGVVLSVQKHEMRRFVRYYMDPDLTIRAK